MRVPSLPFSRQSSQYHNKQSIGNFSLDNIVCSLIFNQILISDLVWRSQLTKLSKLTKLNLLVSLHLEIINDENKDFIHSNIFRFIMKG